MNHDFDGDAGLVVGTVRGFRRWKIREDGYLSPLTRHDPCWTEGVNLARCYDGWASWISGHKTASRDCTCGFYAYFSPAYNQLGGDVEGVIEGHGRATVGTKGFRVERAKIVALVVPRFRLHFLVSYMAYLIGWMALDTGPRMAAGRPGYAVLFAVNLLLAVATLCALVYMMVDDPSKVFFCKPGLRRVLKRRYPGVRLFGSRKAMLRAFPLERPDLSALDRSAA